MEKIYKEFICNECTEGTPCTYKIAINNIGGFTTFFCPAGKTSPRWAEKRKPIKKEKLAFSILRRYPVSGWRGYALAQEGVMYASNGHVMLVDRYTKMPDGVYNKKGIKVNEKIDFPNFKGFVETTMTGAITFTVNVKTELCYVSGSETVSAHGFKYPKHQIELIVDFTGSDFLFINENGLLRCAKDSLIAIVMPLFEDT